MQCTKCTNLVIFFVPDQIISWFISLVIFLGFYPAIPDCSDNLHYLFQVQYMHNTTWKIIQNGHYLCIAWTSYSLIIYNYFRLWFSKFYSFCVCSCDDLFSLLFFSWHRMVHDDCNLQIVGTQSWEVPLMDQTTIMRGTVSLKQTVSHMIVV